MTNQSCIFCKIIKLVAGIGALNWGLVAFLNMNLVEKVTGMGTTASKVIYGVVGAAGALAILSTFICCKACKKP